MSWYTSDAMGNCMFGFVAEPRSPPKIKHISLIDSASSRLFIGKIKSISSQSKYIHIKDMSKNNNIQ